MNLVARGVLRVVLVENSALLHVLPRRVRFGYEFSALPT